MERKIKYARFHTTLYIPGLGQLDTVLPPSNKTIQGLEMWESTGGVSLSAIAGASGAGVLAGEKVTMVIPWGNVVLAVFDGKKAN